MPEVPAEKNKVTKWLKNQPLLGWYIAAVATADFLWVVLKR